ncbi:hypothetical protein C9374_013005 [Naegleria lovaniensis]|uniref:Uncharacterized protein n=1 Tax=Naegleria lovaniensis TaxID=51637 RepID=A0AA88G6E1_NAELO|nr:uncharacterized protein C9374_013005 [Naegleria lovaniensis]KAG2372975.1 hypothetical protein C9374_013005 [Naegleria lovaniensis]
MLQQQQAHSNTFQNILSEMLQACASNNAEAFLSSFKQLQNLQQQPTTELVIGTSCTNSDPSPDASPQVQCSTSTFVASSTSNENSKTCPTQSTPRKKKSNKIPKRYTQLRKQLRDCDHFSENYFVFNSTLTNPSDDQIASSKQQKRNSSIKRSNKVTTEKDSSIVSRKDVKQRRLSKSSESESSLPSSSVNSSNSTPSSQNEQPSIPMYSIINNESLATCQTPSFDEQFQQLVSSWMTVQQYTFQQQQQQPYSQPTASNDEYNALDSTLFQVDFESLPQSENYCTFNLFTESFL